MDHDRRPILDEAICRTCISTVKRSADLIGEEKYMEGLRHLDKLIETITGWHKDEDEQAQKEAEQICADDCGAD